MMPEPDVTSYDSLAAFKEVFQRGQPALLYHKIDWLKSGVRRRGLYISPAIFRRQMLEIRDAGFHSALPGATQTAVTGNTKSIVITFDDGFSNVHQHATPALLECGFHAIQFIVAGLLGKTDIWDRADGERSERLMDAAEIRDWLAAGNEIGAHTITHPRLSRLSPEAARDEIVTSKRKLEDEFQRPVLDFAYPFGDFNDVTKNLVAEAGFERAWSTAPGINSVETDKFAMHRYPVVVSLRRLQYLLRSIHWPFN